MKHTRPCANCRRGSGPLPAGWKHCCWNPIGCVCVSINQSPGPGPSAHVGPRSDDGPGPGLLSWDWREQPDLDELRRLLLGFGVHLTGVDTDSDEYAIVLSAVPLSDAEAVDVFARRWES